MNVNTTLPHLPPRSSIRFSSSSFLRLSPRCARVYVYVSVSSVSQSVSICVTLTCQPVDVCLCLVCVRSPRASACLRSLVAILIANLKSKIVLSYYISLHIIIHVQMPTSTSVVHAHAIHQRPSISMSTSRASIDHASGKLKCKAKPHSHRIRS